MHAAARLSGKGATASGGTALIRHALLFTSKGAEVSDGKISSGFGFARGIANAKGANASQGKAVIDPKQHFNPAKGAAASSGKATVGQPAIDFLGPGKGANASGGKAALDPKQRLNAGKGATASFGRASLGHHVDVLPNSAVLSNFVTFTASLSNFTTFTASLSNSPKLTARITNA
jgi:hypothetical protein